MCVSIVDFEQINAGWAKASVKNLWNQVMCYKLFSFKEEILKIYQDI